MYEDYSPGRKEPPPSTNIEKFRMIASMFPFKLDNKAQVMASLEKNFNNNDHDQYLINCCFRSHDLEKKTFYSQFKSLKCPSIKEPLISSIYRNQCFIEMEEIGKYLSNPDKHSYPGLAKKYPKNFSVLLDSIYQQYQMIPSFERFLLFYPVYLEKHFYYYKCLILESTFPKHEVYFIGMCVSIEMGSAYMLARMVKKYFQHGGSKQWILYEKYPQKYKKILQIMRAVVRSPWTLTPKLVNDIIDENWSVRALAQMFQIMVLIQEMSTISLALGLLPQNPTQLQQIQQIVEVKNKYDKIIYESKVERPRLIDSFKEIPEEYTIECNRKTLNKIEKEQIQPYMREIGAELGSQSIYKQINQIMKPLLPEYKAIEKRNDSIHAKFDASDYNFEEKSFPILQGLTKEMAFRVHDLLKYSQKMTFDNFGTEEKKSTKEFRRACRYYAQNLCGFTHLQYNYKKNIKMNEHTSVPLRFYIRLLTLSPLHIKKQVVKEVNHEVDRIQCFDLGHIGVLIADTKMSLTLMMMTRCLEGYSP